MYICIEVSGCVSVLDLGCAVRTGRNDRDFDRYTMHMVYAPPWLIPSDRTGNDPAFVERTPPLRRALLGVWQRPEEPFGQGYERPPFDH